ncbi:MAG: PAS domain-containing protein [Acidobacteria bacterium]|nr:PAS domain-containing protein [Acidobacteriota bacterium]
MLSNSGSSAPLHEREQVAALALVLDRHGRIVQWNPACTDLIGLALGDVRNRHLWELPLADEDIGQVRAGFLRLQETGSPVELIAGCLILGGTRTIRWSFTPVAGPDGHLEYVLASGVDLTAHRQLEQSFRQAREDLERKSGYLRGIFEHAFQLIGLLAPDGTLLEANRSALEFAGVRRDEVVGRPFWETPWWTHDPILAGRLRLWIGEAARGNFIRLETTHRRTDGHVAVIDFSLMPVRNDRGEVVFIVPEGRDITDRKRAERWQVFLAEAGAVLAGTLDYEETLRNIAALSVRSLADCCIVDLVGEDGEVRRLTVAHAAAERPWFADALERVRLDRSRPHLAWSVLQTGKPIVTPRVEASDVEAFAQDEEHRRALRALDAQSLMAVPLLARGLVIGALIFLAAKPEREYAQEDLRLAEDLARRATLAIENARLYRTAQDAVEARDDVLGVVAHDLRNPLHAIKAAAGLLQRFLDSGSMAAAPQAIDVIRQASDKANRLVADLLEVRRVRAGRLALTREATDPRSLLSECRDSHAPAAAEASLLIAVDAPENLPEVWADRHRVVQALDNLIANAIKFTPAGGRIGLGAETRGHEVVFRVSDTGAGIAGDLLPHIFDRFWQARAGDRRGIGLGLAIAKEVVDAHGGRIWAESQPDAGSTFFFTLPEHDQAASSCAPRSIRS